MDKEEQNSGMACAYQLWLEVWIGEGTSRYGISLFLPSGSCFAPQQRWIAFGGWSRHRLLWTPTMLEHVSYSIGTAVE